MLEQTVDSHKHDAKQHCSSSQAGHQVSCGKEQHSSLSNSRKSTAVVGKVGLASLADWLDQCTMNCTMPTRKGAAAAYLDVAIYVQVLNASELTPKHIKLGADAHNGAYAVDPARTAQGLPIYKRIPTRCLDDSCQAVDGGRLHCTNKVALLLHATSNTYHVSKNATAEWQKLWQKGSCYWRASAVESSVNTHSAVHMLHANCNGICGIVIKSSLGMIACATLQMVHEQMMSIARLPKVYVHTQ